MVPEARLELAQAQGPGDFESPASTDSTTPALNFPVQRSPYIITLSYQKMEVKFIAGENIIYLIPWINASERRVLRTASSLMDKFTKLGKGRRSNLI